MARPVALTAFLAVLTGCGPDALRAALKALEVAVMVANEVHQHHLDGGVECPVVLRDAGVDAWQD